MVALDRRVDNSPRKSATAGRDVAVDATGAVAEATGRISWRIAGLPTVFHRPRFRPPRRAAIGVTAVVLLAGLVPPASAAVPERAFVGSPNPAPAPVADDAPLPGVADAAVDAAVLSTDTSGADAAGDLALDAPDAAGLQPTIQYEQALAHANDRITFQPGSRVAVAFTPRASDGWSVGGATPTALPGGRLDGRALRAHNYTPAAAHTPPRPGPSPRPPSTSRTRTAAGSPRSRRRRWLPGRAQAERATAAPSRPRRPSPEPGFDARSSGSCRTGRSTRASLRLDYSRISTIAYLRVGADAGGNLQKRNPDGSTSVGWSGWTSSRITSIISAAHANHTRVVLTVQSFGWNTTGLNRQRGLLGSATARAEPGPPDRGRGPDRGADGVNLDFEPLARGYDDEFTSLVRCIRAAAQPGPQRLPGDLRHARLDRQLPDRGRDRVGRRGRDLHHGLRLPDRDLEPGRLDRAAQPDGLRPRRHGRGVHRPGRRRRS